MTRDGKNRAGPNGSHTRDLGYINTERVKETVIQNLLTE
jgi:hypothetical protein